MSFVEDTRLVQRKLKALNHFICTLVGSTLAVKYETLFFIYSLKSTYFCGFLKV